MNSVDDLGYSNRRLLKDSLFEQPFGNRERIVTICATSAIAALTCVICLAEFEYGDELRVLPNCKHVFHKGCIDQWLPLRSLLCPLCREHTIKEIETMRRPVCSNYWSRNPAFILAFGLGSNAPLPSQL
ncbi:hypothetical protein Csa_002829 [Cucumis sativus]|nr:hypothetical protein Csa_002829 [Cucumis sativus]